MQDERKLLVPDFTIEDISRAEGFLIIAGIDEAGRGPWAGPVVAGAVVIDPTKVSLDFLNKLDDSKKIKPEYREHLFHILSTTPGVFIGIGKASVEEIDFHNILKATMLAMKRAVYSLKVLPDCILVDGNQKPAMSCAVRNVVKGDSRSFSIAAASIVAKVSRDRIMNILAEEFPGYGWENNAGYGTSQHRTALADLGVTPHHRRSFKPIQSLLQS